MKKRLTKIAALSICGCMMLTGCGKNDQTATQPPVDTNITDVTTSVSDATTDTAASTTAITNNNPIDAVTSNPIPSETTSETLYDPNITTETTEPRQPANITEIEILSGMPTHTMKLTDWESSTGINVTATGEYTADDFTLVVENEDVVDAHISGPISDMFDGIYTSIKPKAIGETYIHVETKDGSVKSNRVKLIVSNDALIAAETNFTIKCGNRCESYLTIESDNIKHTSDLEIINSNPEVATPKFKYEDSSLVGLAYYEIRAMSPGTTTIYFQTKDGSEKSPEITITVEEILVENLKGIDLPDNKLLTGSTRQGVDIEITGIAKAVEDEGDIVVIEYELTNKSSNTWKPQEVMYDHVYQKGNSCYIHLGSKYSTYDTKSKENIKPGEKLKMRVVYILYNVEDDITVIIKGFDTDYSQLSDVAIIAANIDKNNIAKPYANTEKY